MQGAMELRVGHIPKRLLTPVLIAAIGRAWAKHPRLNRVVARGRVWQLAKANVGVRILVAEDELSTIVIPDADQRSVADIQRLLVDGQRQLVARRERRMREEAAGHAAPAPSPEAMALLGPNAASFSVALSNPGKFGLESGAGAFSGTLSPSTDLTVGVRARKPAWFGVAYLPAWQIPIGCLQDHRVFDGREAGEAMQALRAELTPAAVRRLLRAPDTLASDALDSAGDEARWLAAMPPELHLLPTVGLWKYFPVVAGGTALAAGLGIGGYLIVQNLNAAAAAGAASASAAGSVGPAGTAGAGAASAPSAASSTLAAPTVAASASHCSAVTSSGAPCQRLAEANGLCWQHAGR
jgi:hypothetical protein